MAMMEVCIPALAMHHQTEKTPIRYVSPFHILMWELNSTADVFTRYQHPQYNMICIRSVRFHFGSSPSRPEPFSQSCYAVVQWKALRSQLIKFLSRARARRFWVNEFLKRAYNERPCWFTSAGILKTRLLGRVPVATWCWTWRLSAPAFW